jgi:hypothetical protein
LGSDFSYADLTSRDLDQYDTLMRRPRSVRPALNRVDPQDEERSRRPDTKSILWVRQDNFVVIRSVGWLETGGAWHMEIEALEQSTGSGSGPRST